MKNLKNDIQIGRFKLFYLFYGEEDYLKRLYEKHMIEKLIPTGAEMMNLDIQDGKNYQTGTLIKMCETMPFMAERRLVIFHETNLFIPGKKDEAEKTEAYLSGAHLMSGHTTVIFSEAKIDKRSKLYKTIEKTGRAVEFRRPPDSELTEWLVGHFSKNSVAISTRLALRIAANASDMNTMLNEADKLIAYKGCNGKVTEADLELLCEKSPEAGVFELIGAIGNKNQAKALSTYHELLLLKESPIGVLSLMARQFGLMLRAGELKEKRYNDAAIAEALGVKQFVASQAVSQSGRFTAETIKSAYIECLETDYKIKTGRIGDKLGVELLIVKYSGA